MPFQYQKYFTQFGVDEQAIEKERSELSKQFNQKNVSDKDLAWSLFAKLNLEAAKKNNANLLSRIYYSQALFADETRRRNPFDLLQQAAHWKLMEMKELENAGLKYAAKISAFKSCEACKSQDGQIFTIDEALQKMPLPHKECTTQLFNYPGFCRCEYIFERIKEDQSRLTTSNSPRPRPRKVINIALIAIVVLCFACITFGWVLQTFFPIDSAVAIPTSTLSSSVIIPTSTASGTSVDQYMQEYGGNPDVYTKILSLTDCTTLQQEFDQASANLALQSPGTSQYKWSIGYMKASDNRMKQIACY